MGFFNTLELTSILNFFHVFSVSSVYSVVPTNLFPSLNWIMYNVIMTFQCKIVHKYWHTLSSYVSWNIIIA